MGAEPGKVFTDDEINALVAAAEGGFGVPLRGRSPRIVPVTVSGHLAVKAAARAHRDGVRMHRIIDAALEQYFATVD